MPTTTIDGAAIYYEERGSGPAVLYVHGSGDYSAFFVQTAAELGTGFRSIVYDRRGFAGSAGPPASGLAQHVEDAAVLLRRLDATPATVVGSSAGGVVALGLTIAHPDLVSALVLAEPTYQPVLALTVPAARAFATTYLKRWLLRDEEGAATGLYRWITAYRTGGNQYDALPPEWQRVGTAHAHAALREVTQLMRPWPSRRALGSIVCPVTLAVGDLGRPLFHRTSERARLALPGCRVVRVENTAHLLAIDQPRALANAVAGAASATAP